MAVIFDSLFSGVLSRELFVSNIFIMILAGYETSTTTSSLTLHELAHHPDIQDKVRKEIKQVTRESGGKITYDSLKKMKFLDQVLSGEIHIWDEALWQHIEFFTIEYLVHLILVMVIKKKDASETSYFEGLKIWSHASCE
jgi:Cytochrome P450